MSRLLFGFWAFALLLFLTGSVLAAEPTPSDRYRISVLTFGPGDHAFLKFGHNAILVEDAKTGRDDVYNFGTFEFGSPTLISDFLKGRLLYWLSVQSLRGTLRSYQTTNRSIYIQELALQPALEDELVRALEHNALPENRAYKYHYYLDNCSTRVRDVLDRILGGRVREASRAPGGMTWREHTLRLTADDLPVYLGLNVAMGAYIDQPITRWEEMFIPEKLRETLRSVTVPGEKGGVSLVKSERVYFEADRAPGRTAAPRWLLPMGGVGLLLGLVLLGLAELGRRRRSFAVAYFGVLLFQALALGLLGSVFAFFWFFTDHEVAHRNENLLQCPPWALALAALSAAALVRRLRRPVSTDWWTVERSFRRVVFVCAAGSCAGLLLKLLPWFEQENGSVIALLLPFWLGAAFGAWRLASR